jgi:hypothetical protein
MWFNSLFFALKPSLGNTDDTDKTDKSGLHPANSNLESLWLLSKQCI